MPKLILASSSPRRRELLSMLGLEFSIDVSDLDEVIEEGLAPSEVVRQLASQKAAAVAKRQPPETSDTLILAADTIVVLEGRILGKPADRNEAIEMLSRLQGNRHEVFTGVCLIHLPSGRVQSEFERTEVTMAPLLRSEIEHYVDTLEPMDKAGAYGIQGFGATIIEGITGDYFTVMGLPIRRVSLMLKAQGIDIIQEARHSSV
ncbi:Maf family protein [Alicyclobacillus ferrooxydans]|nr:Maf family protein [Alicyclobacillus ferrooxydans]